MLIIRRWAEPIVRIHIEWIRPDTLKEDAAREGDKDFLNTLDEYDEGRLFAPLLHATLNALVNTPENIRSHIVI